MKQLFYTLPALIIVFLSSASAQILPTKWRFIEPLQTGRYLFKALYIGNNQVLVMGGLTQVGDNIPTASCEIINAKTGKTSPAAPMPLPRSDFPAVLTKDGMVVVPGGLITSFGYSGSTTTQVDMYNPATNTWKTLGNLLVRRRQHTAIFLDDERLLVVGGRREDLSSMPDAEIFNIRTGRSQRVGNYFFGVNQPRAEYSRNGDILVFLGRDGGEGSWRDTSVFRFNTTTNKFERGSTLPEQVHIPSITKLKDGRTLLIGGSFFEGIPLELSTALTMETANGVYTKQATMPEGKVWHQTCIYNDQRVIIMGGFNPDRDASARCFWYEWNDNRVTVAPTLNNARTFFEAVTVPIDNDSMNEKGNKIVAISGIRLTNNNREVLKSVEVFDEESCRPEAFQISAGDDQDICSTQDSLTIKVNTVRGSITSVSWVPTTGLACATCIQTKVQRPAIDKRYIVTVTDSAGCVRKDTILLHRNKKEVFCSLPQQHLTVAIDSVYALPVYLHPDGALGYTLVDSVIVSIAVDSTRVLYADSVQIGSLPAKDWTVTYSKAASSLARSVFIMKGSTPIAIQEGILIVPYFRSLLSSHFAANFVLQVELPEYGCIGARTQGAEVEIQNCVLRLRPVKIAATVFGLHSVSPNPTSEGEVQIEFGMGFSGETDIRLYNTEGKEVRQLVNGVQQEGIHSLQFSTENLPSGIYQCVMKAEGHVYTAALSIIK